MHKYKLRQVPRFFGTNWCAIVVPIQVIRWYRQCYNGTDSCAIVVQIRRYCHYRLSCLQRCISFESYIKPQRNRHIEKTFLLYIFWILHQTTTLLELLLFPCCCISFESYIKPQLCPRWWMPSHVVYLLNPTSNHNLMPVSFRASALYIFWILHQTTTPTLPFSHLCSCISFESYIKPQH